MNTGADHCTSAPEPTPNGEATSRALAIGLFGLDAELVSIVVRVAPGASVLHLLGIPEAHARETRVRVRAALGAVGIALDAVAITVHLEPSDVPAAGFDLAIAVAVFAAVRALPADALEGMAFVGELSLSGAIRPVRGVLPRLLGAAKHGVSRVIVPRANAGEAANATSTCVVIAEHLREVVDHLMLGTELEAVGEPHGPTSPPDMRGADLSDVHGSDEAKRALEVAAAGRHDLLFIGPPGSGKTMLARRLSTILPTLTRPEMLEVSAIHSIAGLPQGDHGITTCPPFRAPHHTVSAAGLVGGGDPVRPGEVSLAHLGCLFLDELVEFQRNATDALLIALTRREALICRARRRYAFPARPLTLGAVNPCPCGFFGAGLSSRPCTCTTDRIAKYQERLRAPFYQRFDIRVTLSSVSVGAVRAAAPGESSSTVRERVSKARAIQADRAGSSSRARSNARESDAAMIHAANPDTAGVRFLQEATERLVLSGVERTRVHRVARTIADLEGSDGVTGTHMDEATDLVVPPHERRRADTR